MKLKFANIFILVLSVMLLIYAGSRVVHFVQDTLPANEKIAGYMFLAATEGGIVIWLVYFLSGAHGWQRPISAIMVVVDLLGSAALYTFDTLLVSGQQGLTATLLPEEIRLVLLGMNALVLLNVGAAVACHLLDPDALRRSAEEEAKDKIEAAALAQISRDADNLASELAPIQSARWVNDKRVQYGGASAPAPVAPLVAFGGAGASPAGTSVASVPASKVAGPVPRGIPQPVAAIDTPSEQLFNAPLTSDFEREVVAVRVRE